MIPQTLNSGFAIRVKTTDGKIYQYRYAGVSDFSTVSKTININKNFAQTFIQIPAAGNFMYADGSFGTSGTGAIGIVFSNWTSNTDYNNGYKKGYVMALKNAANAVWAISGYSNTDVQNLTNIETYSLFIHDLDGLTETNKLEVCGISNYPAARSAINYKNNIAAPSASSGWYLPSSGQWYSILVNLGGLSPNSNPTVYSTTYGNNASTYGEAWLFYGMSKSCSESINNKLSISGNYDAISYTSGFGDAFWTSSETRGISARGIGFASTSARLDFASYGKSTNDMVRAVLAF